MEIFTIGYSGFTIDSFVYTLKQFDIKCVVDVRSIPFSKFHPDYNKDFLCKVLNENKILYRHYANEFGARQNDHSFYDEDGILDFHKFIASEQFQSGISKVENGIQIGYSFAMMCAEKDPINCHRSIMVGQGFKKSGFSVKNIIDENRYESQEALEDRLLDMYFADRNQLSIFDLSIIPPNESDLINRGYVKRNKEIGFRINNLAEEN